MEKKSKEKKLPQVPNILVGTFYKTITIQKVNIILHCEFFRKISSYIVNMEKKSKEKNYQNEP